MRRTSRWYLGLYGASLGALCVVGLAFAALAQSARVEAPTSLDHVAHAWVVRHRAQWPLVTRLFRWATLFGDPDIATLATGLTAVGLYVLHRQRLGGVRPAEPLVWLGAIAGGRLLSNALKEFFKRQRPPLGERLVVETNYSFPSAHSVFAAVFFSMLAYLLVRAIPPARRWLRTGATFACVLLAVIVAASRVWLGVHYPTDVMAGMLLGVAWTFTVWVARVAWEQWRADSGRGAA
jgi:membrane-associated phospholipid phosphatase